MEKINFLDRKRIVVKVGTSSITKPDYVDIDLMAKISDQLIDLRNNNHYITLVSSGAIARGKQALQEFNNKNHEDMVRDQYFASIGQPELMHSWSNAFRQHNYFGSQILVDNYDFSLEKSLDNLKKLYEYTLNQKCIPVFNENDALSTEEIKFGDNDILASHIAAELNNDLLLILMTKDGIYKNGKVVEQARSFNKDDYDSLPDSENGRGGIESKLKAAENCNKKSIPCIVANVSYTLYDILKGDCPRTVFIPAQNTQIK